MLYHVMCEDVENGRDLRKAIRPSHLVYMIEHIDNIVFGGPLIDDNGVTKGSVMVMEFKDQESLSIFLKDEPYTAAGLFEKVSVSAMKQMVPQIYPEFLKNEYLKEISVP